MIRDNDVIIRKIALILMEELGFEICHRERETNFTSG